MMIQKKNLHGDVVFQYDGKVIQRDEYAIVLEAFFGRDDMTFMNITLKRGDRFVETFYTDRWYNIFEIFDRDTGAFKGWYCNIGKPAMIEDDAVSYVDLALDLWVAPNGDQTILDEDELLELNLDDHVQQHVYASMHELQELLKTKNPPS